jgi:hypothetical protein
MTEKQTIAIKKKMYLEVEREIDRYAAWLEFTDTGAKIPWTAWLVQKQRKIRDERFKAQYGEPN